MAHEYYKNSPAILAQAYKGIEMAAKALQDYADEPYFASDKYDSLEPAFATYLSMGRCLAAAKWARNRRQEEEKSKGSQKEAAIASQGISLDEVPLPNQTKSSYQLKNNSLVLEFSSSKALTEDEERKYKHFVVASMGSSPITDNVSLTSAITTFEKNKEEILKDRNEIDESFKFVPENYKVFLLERAKASGTISELGEKQLKEMKEESPLIESETEQGVVCCSNLRIGEEIFLKKEDGELAPLAVANLQVMEGVLISSEDGKITDINPKGLMKDIRLAD